MRSRRRLAVLATAMVAGASLPASGFEEMPPIEWHQPAELGLIPGEQIANPPPPALKIGSQGDWVARLQEHLATASLFRGRIDGVFGGATRGAVYAFQKVHNLERTGVFAASDWRFFSREISGPGSGPEASRVEVDLNRQLLYLIEAEELAGVFTISSANGESYRNARGRVVRANTPEGRFTFQRSRAGWWESYLGFLYRPHYFYGGYAIHGSSSVPPFPASHGCVRVEIVDMDFLATRLRVGMPIYVYGDDVARNDLIETPVTPPPPSPPAI